MGNSDREEDLEPIKAGENDMKANGDMDQVEQTNQANSESNDKGENGDKIFKKAFAMFDLDGSGEISASEFGTVVRSLGENPTDEEVEIMLKSVDRDENGTLNFSEFCKLMSNRVESRKDVQEDELFRKAFKVFDKDNSGKLSRQELRNIVTSYGKMKLTEQDADEMLAVADSDGDDMIDYEEFVKLFTDKGIFFTDESSEP